MSEWALDEGAYGDYGFSYRVPWVVADGEVHFGQPGTLHDDLLADLELEDYQALGVIENADTEIQNVAQFQPLGGEYTEWVADEYDERRGWSHNANRRTKTSAWELGDEGEGPFYKWMAVPGGEMHVWETDGLDGQPGHQQVLAEHYPGLELWDLLFDEPPMHAGSAGLDWVSDCETPSPYEDEVLARVAELEGRKTANADGWWEPAQTNLNEGVEIPGEAPGMPRAQNPRTLENEKECSTCESPIPIGSSRCGWCGSEQVPSWERRPKTAAGEADNWAYLDGRVAFGGPHWDLAEGLARDLGLPEDQARMVGNLVARDQAPEGHDLATGSVVVRRGKRYPQIWVSTADRNAVWDAVAEALGQRTSAWDFESQEPEPEYRDQDMLWRVAFYIDPATGVPWLGEPGQHHPFPLPANAIMGDIDVAARPPSVQFYNLSPWSEEARAYTQTLRQMAARTARSGHRLPALGHRDPGWVPVPDPRPGARAGHSAPREAADWGLSQWYDSGNPAIADEEGGLYSGRGLHLNSRRRPWVVTNGGEVIIGEPGAHHNDLGAIGSDWDFIQAQVRSLGMVDDSGEVYMYQALQALPQDKTEVERALAAEGAHLAMAEPEIELVWGGDYRDFSTGELEPGDDANGAVQAWQGGEMVGSLWYEPRADEVQVWQAWIDPAYRGTGLLERMGQRLVEEYGLPLTAMKSKTRTEFRVGAAPQMPPAPGEVPIPEGFIRLFHYTGAPPEAVREQGLRIENAKGENYGEPNRIWASAQFPDRSLEAGNNVVEFAVPYNDSRWDIGAYSPGVNYGPLDPETGAFGEGKGPEAWAQSLYDRASHVTFNGSIGPGEILAVHEPWHEDLRYMVENEMDPAQYAWVRQDPERWGRYVRALDEYEAIRKTASPMFNYEFVPFTGEELAAYDALSQGERRAWQRRADRQNKRAREKGGAPGRVSGRELYSLAQRFENRCAYCDTPLQWGTEQATIDHARPLAIGGAADVSNMVPSCFNCNQELNKWDSDLNPGMNNPGYEVPEWFQAEPALA